MKNLPDKLSDLIQVALKDLEAVEKDKRYKVNMGLWHDPRDRTCYVCVGGAVMARTLKANRRVPSWPCDFLGDVQGKLIALNQLRCGRVSDALFLLGREGNHDFDRPITDYDDDADRFKSDMRQLAADLRKAGL